ncbi:MAG TPA: 5-formyltetrahydrofolate cyclo-ligase [Methanocorpusculum sp.]|nr:5-formyltetrahydrofolate cyclo-ligase [Methanocorpusculum sp.]
MVSKSELRSLLKERREALDLGVRREAGYYITNRVLALLAPYESILVYAAKVPEVETEVLINILLEEKKKVIVPIIQKESHTLRFSYITSMEDFVPGTFNVPEPLERERPAPAEAIEICVVPMVGFDRSGNRLGYGAGYYDRFFAAYPDVPKIGLAYACQECGEVPADAFDVKMDWVVTEKEVIVCR